MNTDNKQKKFFKTNFKPVRTDAVKSTFLKISETLKIKKGVDFLSSKGILRPALCVVATGLFFSIGSLFFSPGYDVYMNGKVVGIVTDKSQFQQALSDANATIDTLTGSYDRVLYTPSYVYTLTAKTNITSADELKRNIMALSSGVCEAYTLVADGNALVSFKNVSEADETLSLLKQSYSGNNPVILNEITYVSEFVPVSAVETASSAYLKLYDQLQVQTSEEVTYTATVPYKTVTTESADIYSGNEKIVTAGENGSAQVVALVTRVNGVETASETISSTEITPTVTQAVVVGTKPRPSGVGTGDLITPFYGTVTSRYGTREGRNHKGIDIGGAINSNIYAADEGVVTTAKYFHDYGNLVIIDHQNGMQTYYAHLNSIGVSVGDAVGKGDVIGKLGSTGYSTGPHLHYEVRKNGVPCDPSAYMDY